MRIVKKPVKFQGISWRRIALLVHRYVGLVMVLFLVTAGLTGTIITFQEELDEWLNPKLFHIAEAERHLPNLDPFDFRVQVERQLPPGGTFNDVYFNVDGRRTKKIWVKEQPDQWSEWFMSPKTGLKVGSRTWADLSEGKVNLITFLYRFHYSLGLGDVGIVIFGVIALLWSFDCFVGAYLTFPQNFQDRKSKKSFVVRWLPAWFLRTKQLFSLVFTWHRASGLWVWALLFVFAWSGVGFNLRPIYRPVMSALTGMQLEAYELLPQRTPPFSKPELSFQKARELARKEMAREAQQRGFSIEREVQLNYSEERGTFSYVVASSFDISPRFPGTEVYLDGNGQFLHFSAPSGIHVGNTISNWLVYLHLGAVFGLWYRLVVALVGLVVVGLSITGVWIWWRKRAKSTARSRAQSSLSLPVKAHRPSRSHVEI